MNRSISLYWRNETGVEPAEFYDGYGMVMLDWAHGAQEWINDYQPMDNGAGDTIHELRVLPLPMDV
jgi:hypothetical protein